MKHIKFHPDTYLEIENAYNWYQLQAHGLGDDFIRELESGLLLITNMPDAWSKISKKCRRYLLKKFPFGIIYYIKEDIIYILAIMHCNREPGYWANKT